jgi:8-oxo-dGTP pyrophosphatase MutT (NUDIX family)
MPERADEAGWRVVDSEIVIETPHLRLRRDDIVLPGGDRIGNYYVRESRGFAVIFALTPDERVLLVEQYKHGVGRQVLELPAGAIDPGETPEACATRELAEETGFRSPAPLEHVATYVTDPTNSDARFHLFFAANVGLAGAQHLDITEKIEVSSVPLDALRGLVREGKIEVSSHVAAIYVMLDRLGKL